MNLTHSIIVLADKPIGVISSQAPEVTYFMQAYLYDTKISESVKATQQRGHYQKCLSVCNKTAKTVLCIQESLHHCCLMF